MPEELNAELARLKKRLAACEERYRALTETSVDAVVTTDGSDTILTWNKGAADMFGYGPEVIGQPVVTIIPERYRAAHSRGLKRFLETGERHILGKKTELYALRADGRVFPIELSLSTWEGAEGPLFGGIIRDLSERRLAEYQRETAQRILRHDLKSSLVGIGGLAERLAKDPHCGPRQIEKAALIAALAKKMLTFINRSADLYRIERGEYTLAAKPLDLFDVFRAVLDELAELSRIKTSAVTLLCDGRLAEPADAAPLTGDRGLLENLFANLLKNALEACPAGSPVTVAVTAADGHVTVDIHNLGTVPENVRDRFFEPYATSGKVHGTGLGTYAARRFAEAHGGRIAFTTSEDEGTHVIVILPQRPAPPLPGDAG